MYGRNPVYRDFEVTGWHVARCLACLKTVRGHAGALKVHKRTCPQRRGAACKSPSSPSSMAQRRRVRTTPAAPTAKLLSHGEATGPDTRRRRAADKPSQRTPRVVTKYQRIAARCGGGTSAAGTVAADAAAAASCVATTRAGGGGSRSGTAAVKPDSGSPHVAHAADGRSGRSAASAVECEAGGGEARAGGTGDGVSRRVWAAGVGDEGGPEAVAAALRARYPRLYGLKSEA